MNPDLNRRSMIGVSAGAIAAILGGCGTSDTRASTAVSESPASASATTLMVVRHAEKPTKDVGGVLPDGTRDRHSLSVRGWQRAGALVELFAAHGPTGRTATRPGLSVPTAVFASQPGGEGSRRPSQTVTPVAEALGIAVQTPVAIGSEAAVAARVRDRAGVTLLAWEHRRIPTILAALGTISPAPPTSWPDDRFDVVWVLTRTGGSWSFQQVPQLLLSGDQDRPIT